MVVRTKLELLAEVNTRLASNPDNDLTAADIRSVMVDMIDSFAVTNPFEELGNLVYPRITRAFLSRTETPVFVIPEDVNWFLFNFDLSGNSWFIVDGQLLLHENNKKNYGLNGDTTNVLTRIRFSIPGTSRTTIAAWTEVTGNNGEKEKRLILGGTGTVVSTVVRLKIYTIN